MHDSITVEIKKNPRLPTGIFTSVSVMIFVLSNISVGVEYSAYFIARYSLLMQGISLPNELIMQICLCQT